MKKVSVYNLEFPDYVHSLTIGDYTFERVKNYGEVVVKLQNIITSSGSEFERPLCTGTHQFTAIVELPEKEKPSVLAWTKGNFTQFHDVLLLLTLFTGRNVFAINEKEDGLPLRPDPRGHFWGGQLRLSLENNVWWRNKKTNKLISEEQMQKEKKQVWDYDHLDLGLEKTLNNILQTISSKEWANQYDGGYFLFTYRQTLQQQYIDQAFVLCWTIWEHLFTLSNKAWLDDTTIEQISGDKKIAFIYNRYLLVDIDSQARKEIKRITGARNRLIHYGKIPTNVDIKEMILFVRLTEQIMAIILGLQPSNVFNSTESLQDFLKRKKVDII